MRFHNEPGHYVAHYTRGDTAIDHILKNRSLRLGPLIATNDPRETAMIAEMYFLQRQFNSSIEYYDKAKEVFLLTGNTEFIIEAIERKGLAYDFIGKPYDALKYWNEAISLCKKHNLKDRQKLILSNINKVKNN